MSALKLIQVQNGPFSSLAVFAPILEEEKNKIIFPQEI
jgi:hypothetical protein